MSERLFLQFQEIHSGQVQWFHLMDSRIQASGQQPLDELTELKQQFPGLPIIILVPAQDCLVNSVALPTRQRRQQLKAIPFVLEEQVAEDIDDMHFAIGKRDQTGKIPVIVVARSRMKQWVELLENAGINAAAMLPPSALLEAPEGAWSIMELGDRYIVNQGGECWSADAEEAAMMLQLSLEEMKEDELPSLLYWGGEDAPSWIAGLGLEFSAHPVQDGQQALLARYEPQSLNLLQGEFENQDNLSAGWKIWKRAAIVAAVAVLVKVSIMGFDLYRLNDEADYLRKQITKVYHSVAPGARIVDPERQMRQLIANSQGAQGESGSFLVMLGVVAEGLAANPGIQPTNLHYDGSRGEIRLDLLVSNLPVLDQLKAHLTGKGLSIEMGGASAQGSSYSGRLIIRSNS